MELHCFPRVECRNGSRSRRRVGEGLLLLLLPLLFSSSFPPVSGQTRKIYFLGVGGGGGEGTGGESRHHPPTHEYQERLTNYRVKYCNLLMGEMRDSGKETGPHRSFVLHHVLRLSSNLRFPSRRLPARSLSPPTPCPPPDCPLFINAIKETECRASTVGFLPCRCREPAVTLGENISAGKRIRRSWRQRGLSIPNSHRENSTFRPFPTLRFYPSDVHPRYI